MEWGAPTTSCWTLPALLEAVEVSLLQNLVDARVRTLAQCIFLMKGPRAIWTAFSNNLVYAVFWSTCTLWANNAAPTSSTVIAWGLDGQRKTDRWSVLCYYTCFPYVAWRMEASNPALGLTVYKVQSHKLVLLTLTMVLQIKLGWVASIFQMKKQILKVSKSQNYEASAQGFKHRPFNSLSLHIASALPCTIYFTKLHQRCKSSPSKGKPQLMLQNLLEIRSIKVRQIFKGRVMVRCGRQVKES